LTSLEPTPNKTFVHFSRVVRPAVSYIRQKAPCKVKARLFAVAHGLTEHWKTEFALCHSVNDDSSQRDTVRFGARSRIHIPHTEADMSVMKAVCASYTQKTAVRGGAFTFHARLRPPRPQRRALSMRVYANDLNKWYVLSLCLCLRLGPRAARSRFRGIRPASYVRV